MKLNAVFFFGLSKAFDTVNHPILLQKLYSYGIHGVQLQWFKSYLENRTRYVEVRNVKSSPLTIQYGVPQGSALGPFLLLIHVNDMPKKGKYKNICWWHHSILLIQFPTGPWKNYCSANKLSVNFKKIHYMIISSLQKANKLTLNIQSIGEKKKTTTNRHLHWQESKLGYPHSTHISKNMGILFQLRHFLPFLSLKNYELGKHIPKQINKSPNKAK